MITIGKLADSWKGLVPLGISVLWRRRGLAGLAAILIIMWTFGGWVYRDDFEGEGYVDFFIKEKPSLTHARFRDSYASDSYVSEEETSARKDQNGHWLPNTLEFREYSLYCWHRYGIANIDFASNLQECRKLARNHGNWFSP